MTEGLKQSGALSGIGEFFRSGSDDSVSNAGELGLYRAIFDRSPLAISISRLSDGMFCLVNPAFESLSGYRMDELVGRTSRSVGLWPEDYSREEIMGRLQREGSLHGFTGDMCCGDGRRRHCRVNLECLGEGDSALLLVYVLDITEHKQAQDEVRRHEEELAHVDRLSMLGEMASTLAHEISGPLSAIQTQLDAGRRMLDQGAEADIRTIFADCQEQAGRAVAVIGRIRDYVRHQEAEHEVLDLVDVIHRSVKFIGAEARDQDITIFQDLECHTSLVRGDGIQLEQVLLNLVRNGMESISESDAKREIRIQLRQSERQELEVSVSDTGCGMNDDALAHAFNSFYTTKDNGLGIGLTVCRSIIKSHGGRLWAIRGVDAGMVFKFTLPQLHKE